MKTTIALVILVALGGPFLLVVDTHIWRAAFDNIVPLVGRENAGELCVTGSVISKAMAVIIAIVRSGGLP